MTAFHWFVVLASLSSLIFAWATYLLESFKKKNEKTEIDEEEEKLVELIGKVRVFVDSKLEQLDKKMEEARTIIKEMNEQYVSLSSLIVQLENQSTGSVVRENASLIRTEDISNSSKESSSTTYKSLQNNQYILQSQRVQTDVGQEKGTLDDDYLSYEKQEDLESEKKEIVIFDMYLSGIEPVEIAKRMKMGVGEVQLIIDLMKRQKT